MRNRETLGNVIFADPTASKAIAYVSIGEKRWARKRLRSSRIFPDSDNVINISHTKTNPVVIYSARNELAITQPPQILKTKDLQTTRITELNGQLSVLRQQKKRGEIAPSYYRIRQKELAEELHAEMERRGHKPIKTKKLHR